MNTPAVRDAPRGSPVETFRQQVLPPDKATDLWRSLPSHIKPAVFERNLMNALMQNPDLITFHPSLVYREVSKAAGLGLLLDPILGEAYIVIAWNGRTKRKEPQLRIGYKGMCKLARQASDVTNIYAHEVCANDTIRCQLGTDKQLVHEPDLYSDRGAVVGYYAVIKFRDGIFDFEPMTVKQVHAIRDRSDAWKAFSEQKIKSTPWSTDEDEMAKKTVLRRLMKRQAQSPELAEAIKIEDEAEFPELRTPAPRLVPDDGPPAPPPAVTHQPQETVNTVPAAEDASYVDLVESGRSEPGEVMWEDEVPDPETAASSHAAARSSPDERHLAGEDQLISEIDALESVLGCLQWAKRNEAALAALAKPARSRVDAKFIQKQDALNRDERR